MTESTYQRSIAGLIVLLIWPWLAVAQQSYPTKPIRVVIAFAPAGPADIVARLVAPAVGEALGQPLVIDNRPGANGVIAAMAVVRAKPDGQTLLFSSNSALATNVSLVKALPYDPLKVFTPIAGGSITATAVIVKASSSFKTFAEFIAAARKTPGKITFGHGSSFVQGQVANMNTKGGVQLMGVGDTFRFWIPEKLAYQGQPGAPAGMLVFDVELLAIKAGKKPIPAPDDVAAAPADAQKTASGLAWKVLTPGKGGAHPTADSSVEVHYTGWTTDGKMFDSSVQRGQTAKFPLKGVIAGWTEGLQLMEVGMKARFWIPEELAYKGRPGRPAGMLVFDVELIGIQ